MWLCIAVVVLALASALIWTWIIPTT